MVNPSFARAHSLSAEHSPVALLLDTTRRRAVIWTGVDLDIEIMLGWVGLVFSLMMGWEAGARGGAHRARTPSLKDESRKQSRGCACSAAALAAINANLIPDVRVGSCSSAAAGPRTQMAAPQAL